MVITKEWIELNAVGRVGWTRAQLKCLGIGWPPRTGWKRNLVGQEICDANAREFERLGAAERQRKAANVVQGTWL